MFHNNYSAPLQFICISLHYTIKCEKSNVSRQIDAQYKINTAVEMNTCLFQMVCQLPRGALASQLEPSLCNGLCGVEWMSWVTGGWWCCLSLYIVSPIPMVRDNSQLLCGLYGFPCAKVSNSKTIYICIYSFVRHVIIDHV